MVGCRGPPWVEWYWRAREVGSARVCVCLCVAAAAGEALSLSLSGGWAGLAWRAHSDPAHMPLGTQHGAAAAKAHLLQETLCQLSGAVSAVCGEPSLLTHPAATGFSS